MQSVSKVLGLLMPAVLFPLFLSDRLVADIDPEPSASAAAAFTANLDPISMEASPALEAALAAAAAALALRASDCTCEPQAPLACCRLEMSWHAAAALLPEPVDELVDDAGEGGTDASAAAVEASSDCSGAEDDDDANSPEKDSR